MGAGFSGSAAGDGGDQTRLEDIPESCLALVLNFLDPPDICKLARLNRAFRRASSADFVWQSKLPQNYQILVDKLFDERSQCLSKKDIYARLCLPNRFDGGNKDVCLEKSSGGVCVSISWKDMKITGIDDRRYWTHIPTHESRFNTVAYLQQIWWLEVDGELDFQFPAGSYSLFFRLQLGKSSMKLGRRPHNHDQVHGWDIKPVQFQLSTSNGHRATSQCYLKELGKWVHYHVGDFVVENQEKVLKVKFSLTQIDCTHTKGGLWLDSVFICPSELGDGLKQF